MEIKILRNKSEFTTRGVDSPEEVVLLIQEDKERYLLFFVDKL
jgi:hypothetical protein